MARHRIAARGLRGVDARAVVSDEAEVDELAVGLDSRRDRAAGDRDHRVLGRFQPSCSAISKPWVLAPSV